MKKWEKVLFWIIIVTIGILFIGLLVGLDLRGLIGAVVTIDIMIILDTAFMDMRSKWGAFGLKILIVFLILLVVGFMLDISSENGGELLTLIIILELFETFTKKKVNASKKV